jgi:hypothetical protein
MGHRLRENRCEAYKDKRHMVLYVQKTWDVVRSQAMKELRLEDQTLGSHLIFIQKTVEKEGGWGGGILCRSCEREISPTEMARVHYRDMI